MKTFINRFVAILLSVLLIGSNSVYAQNWSSYQWQPQNAASQKNNPPKTGNSVEDPLADLINQAKDIREALLSDDEKAQPLISQNDFKSMYQEEVQKAYQQAKQEAKNDPQKLKQINQQYQTLSSAQEITNQWNKSYKSRFADLPESKDMTETEKELRNFGKLVMDAYDANKTQSLLDIIEQDFPLYASIGALDSKVRNRARAVLRGIVSGNAPACGNKGFSSGKCNKAIQAAATLAILGDFNDSKRTDLIPLETLLTKAYEGPLAYSAVFLAAGALLTAGQTGAIKSLLVGAATQAKEKQEKLLGGPLFMPSTWINAVQSGGGDSYYITGYENTFYDISSLDEGSGCVLTDLGEYFAEEAAKGNRNAKEILNSVANQTIQATPFRGANRLMDVQMTPFWAGAISSGYVVQNMGYRGTALDGNGRSFNVDTVQYWNDAAAKIRQQGTDYTGYIAYQLYKNKKAAVNAWTALYANNRLAKVVQARNPNKQAAIYEQPTSGQMSKVKTQQVFLNVIGPVGDFVVEWAIGDLAFTGSLSTVQSIGKAVKGVKAIRFRNLQRVVKAARAGLTTKLTTFATKAKTPKEIKKIQRLRKAVLRSQRRKAARLELYARFSTSFGVRTRIPAPALTGSQAVVKGTQAGKEVVGAGHGAKSGKSVVEISENAHVNTQLGLQKVEAPKSFAAQAKVQAPAQNSGLAGRAHTAPKSAPAAPKVEVPATTPTPKADAVPATNIESKLTGPLDSKVTSAQGVETVKSAKPDNWLSRLFGKSTQASKKAHTNAQFEIFKEEASKIIGNQSVHTEQIQEADKLARTIQEFCAANEKALTPQETRELRTIISDLKAKKVQAIYDQRLGKITYTAQDVKKMFPNGKLPASSYTDQIWGKPIRDRKGKIIQVFDRKIDDATAQITALYMDALGKDAKYWESLSGISGVTKKEVITNFAKYTNVQGTSDFYINLAKQSPKDFENIMESMLNQVRVKGSNYIFDYKKSSWPINSGISSYNIDFVKSMFSTNNPYRWDYIGYFKNNSAAVEQINGLTDLIAQSSLKNKTTLYRGEQLDGVLNLLKDAKGRPIKAGKSIEKFIKGHPNATSAEVESFVDNLLSGYKFEQDRFMSTTINRDFAVEWATSNKINGGKKNPVSVVWKIKADKGAKGVFASPFDAISNNYYDQFEFLVQRQSALKYVDCAFDKKTGILEIEVLLDQTKTPEAVKIVDYSKEIMNLSNAYVEINIERTKGILPDFMFQSRETAINRDVLNAINGGFYSIQLAPQPVPVMPQPFYMSKRPYMF